MIYLQSSAIRGVDYEQHSQTLSIWFVESGGPYDYYGVPDYVYQGLISATSAGAYFNDHIRDRYSSRR